MKRKVEKCATRNVLMAHLSVDLQGKTTRRGDKDFGNRFGREGTSLCKEIVYDEARLNYWPLRLGRPLVDLSTLRLCVICDRRQHQYQRREETMHGLVARGRAHDMDGNLLPVGSRLGRGKCSCGDMSLPLRTNADRARWHVRHKGGIKARRTIYDKKKDAGPD